MSTKLTRETSVTFDAQDILNMVTEEVCSYGSLADLQATFINQNADGDFEVTFEPKPVEEAA